MPEFTSFLSPAYKLESVNQASSSMRNCFLSVIEQGPRKGKFRLQGIPGLKDFGTLPTSPVRGLLSIDGGNRLFAVAGDRVYEVFGDGTSTALTGSIALNSHPVTMATNGFELAIASAGLLYIALGGSPGSVSQAFFTDGTPIKAGTVDFLIQYFIVNIIDSQAINISNLAPDGAIWDPGDTQLAESYPDAVLRVLADNSQLWLFGTDTTEVWAPIDAVFPFQLIPGAVLKYGITSPYSAAAAGGFRFWHWNNVIYSAYGIEPQRISDDGVEQAMRSYGKNDDAEGWTQIFGQRIFYVINFPSAQKTWVYDQSLKCWHERGQFQAGNFGIYRGRVYARAFGKDLVGDPQTGDIYQIDPNTYTDAHGSVLRRERTADYITYDMKNYRYSQLTIDGDTGVGLDVPADQPGYDPQLVMRYSDNRGKTWSAELQTTMGKIGEDDIRMIYNQLGSSRIGKTFQVYMTDPAPFLLNTAYLRISPPEPGR